MPRHSYLTAFSRPVLIPFRERVAPGGEDGQGVAAGDGDLLFAGPIRQVLTAGEVEVMLEHLQFPHAEVGLPHKVIHLLVVHVDVVAVVATFVCNKCPAPVCHSLCVCFLVAYSSSHRQSVSRGRKSLDNFTWLLH